MTKEAVVISTSVGDPPIYLVIQFGLLGSPAFTFWVPKDRTGYRPPPLDVEHCVRVHRLIPRAIPGHLGAVCLRPNKEQVDPAETQFRGKVDQLNVQPGRPPR